MRILIRLLSLVVIASAAITVWTRAGLVLVLGPQLASVCLWIAAGGSLCAVVVLARTRKRARRQPRRAPEPPPGRVARRGGDRTAVLTGQEPPR